MDSQDILISVTDVSKRYGDHTVLEHIHITVRRGEMLAIIGPNGSGKSTLSRMIVGLEKPTSGIINVFGKAPEEASHLIGFVPQYFHFDRTLPITVEEFLQLSACRTKSHNQCASTHAALQLVGMEMHAHRMLGVLSGGQLQRVLIARALLHEREVLILDEPVSSVDVGGEQALYDLLMKLKEERGTTSIIVSHELEFVTTYATQVLCVNREQICHGVPSDVLSPDVMKKLYGAHKGPYPHTCK